MKKILICAHKMHCGGTETALLELLKRLNGNDVTLLLERIEGEWLPLIPPFVKVKELKLSKTSKYKYLFDVNPYNSEKKIKRFENKRRRINLLIGHLRIKRSFIYKKLLKYALPLEEEFDIALDFHSYGYFLTAYVAEKVNTKRKATWIHSLDLACVNYTDKFLKYYDKIFCVSKATKDNFDNRYPELAEKSEVFYNFMDVDAILDKASKPISDEKFKGNFKIVSVGRLSSEKGFDIAIDAAKLLSDNGYDFSWYIIGDGNEKSNLNSRIGELQLKDKVILSGRKDNPMPYIKAANLYVQPSRQEGFGLTIAEAKILGKLIVASDLPSIREQIESGINGFLVFPDAKNFYKAIKDVISDGEIVRMVRKNAEKTEILQTDLIKIYNV